MKKLILFTFMFSLFSFQIKAQVTICHMYSIMLCQTVNVCWYNFCDINDHPYNVTICMQDSIKTTKHFSDKKCKELMKLQLIIPKCINILQSMYEISDQYKNLLENNCPILNPRI